MESRFKEIASLIGDATRATILWVLLDGKAFTATELAIAADTSPQNISMHLSKLVEAELLSVESQGRHKYYKFSSKDIAYAIEALANLIPPAKTIKTKESPVTYCRTCYDHLAGKVGVLITDSLLQQKVIDSNFEVSKKGEKWFADFGILTEELKKQRRSFLRPCLDWSERRQHIAGSLATALLDSMLEDDWIRRTKNSRAIVITAKGQKKTWEYFKINI
jgi:DNA-binding transcriptional ArsR family regulator